MPPDARGSCTDCQTQDFECICDAASVHPGSRGVEIWKPDVSTEVTQEAVWRKLHQRRRKRQRPQATSDESSTEMTEEANQDMLAVAQRDAEQWRQRSGVMWESYQSANDAAAVLEAAKKLVVNPYVKSDYCGVCKSPAQRFYEKPTAEWVPHTERFHAMYVLSLGCDMGTLEKKIIRDCRRVVPGKCLNRSAGGEHVHRKSVRFAYVAVRFQDGNES